MDITRQKAYTNTRKLSLVVEKFSIIFFRLLLVLPSLFSPPDGQIGNKKAKEKLLYLLKVFFPIAAPVLYIKFHL